MPKVSVIIPTYNSARYITAAVESVLAQTFTDYELIVVDDGSTDETRQVLQQYEGKLTYIYQENQGRSAARNTGIGAASGDYIAFLDSDDLWLPKKLECQVPILDHHPAVALVYSQLLYIDSRGNPVRFRGKWVYGDDESRIIIADRCKDLFLGCVVSGGGSNAVVRRSLLDEVGLFDEALSYPEDWDLWLRLSRKGPFAYIPEPLGYYRVYGWSKVLAIEASERLVAQHLRIIEKAVAAWDGDTDERDQLRAQAVATIYTRAALANFQLGRALQGQSHLEKAMMSDPGMISRERLIQLAVDRAKLIETETGSYQEAEAFIHTFFSNLPAVAAQFKNAHKETVGWLYVAGAFERQGDGDTAAVRRLLRRGIAHAPVCLKNLGVVSVALEAWLGKVTASMLRQLVNISRFIPVDHSISDCAELSSGCKGVSDGVAL